MTFYSFPSSGPGRSRIKRAAPKPDIRWRLRWALLFYGSTGVVVIGWTKLGLLVGAIPGVLIGAGFAWVTYDEIHQDPRNEKTDSRR